MSQSSALLNSIAKVSLPCLKPPFTKDGPSQKRLLLDQGELAQLYDGPAGVRYIAAIELRPGFVRGNHYHRLKEECVYVVSGTLELLLADPKTGATRRLLLAQGDSVVVPPGIAHTLVPVDAGFAIEYSPQQFDAADTFRLQVAAP